MPPGHFFLLPPFPRLSRKTAHKTVRLPLFFAFVVAKVIFIERRTLGTRSVGGDFLQMETPPGTLCDFSKWLCSSGTFEENNFDSVPPGTILPTYFKNSTTPLHEKISSLAILFSTLAYLISQAYLTKIFVGWRLIQADFLFGIKFSIWRSNSVTSHEILGPIHNHHLREQRRWPAVAITSNIFLKLTTIVLEDSWLLIQKIFISLSHEKNNFWILLRIWSCGPMKAEIRYIKFSGFSRILHVFRWLCGPRLKLHTVRPGPSVMVFFHKKWETTDDAISKSHSASISHQI